MIFALTYTVGKNISHAFKTGICICANKDGCWHVGDSRSQRSGCHETACTEEVR